jgi:hypothetical protein
MLRLRKSGRKPTAGDIFAIGLPTDAYIFGRVVAGPLPRERAPMPGAYLVYVYRHRSIRPKPEIAELGPQNLLIPPVFINQLGWTKGYFLPVGSQPIRPPDRLPRHCFRRWTGECLDDTGQPLPAPTEPCGEWALGNHRTLDDQISQALGIPPAPER